MKKIKLSEVTRMGSGALFESAKAGEPSCIVISGRGVKSDIEYVIDLVDNFNETTDVKTMAEFKGAPGIQLAKLENVGDKLFVGVKGAGRPYSDSSYAYIYKIERV